MRNGKKRVAASEGMIGYDRWAQDIEQHIENITLEPPARDIGKKALRKVNGSLPEYTRV